MTEQALLCCVEIYIKINAYWLAIKFIPLSPELFSLFLLPFLIPNDCLSAQWGIFRCLEISSCLVCINSTAAHEPACHPNQAGDEWQHIKSQSFNWFWLEEEEKSWWKGKSPRRLSVESKILACRQRLICVCIFSEACIMALTLSLLIVTISSKPPC